MRQHQGVRTALEAQATRIIAEQITREKRPSQVLTFISVNLMISAATETCTLLQRHTTRDVRQRNASLLGIWCEHQTLLRANSDADAAERLTFTIIVSAYLFSVTLADSTANGEEATSARTFIGWPPVRRTTTGGGEGP